jgi:hypothetical protein
VFVGERCKSLVVDSSARRRRSGTTNADNLFFVDQRSGRTATIITSDVCLSPDLLICRSTRDTPTCCTEWG